MSNLKRLWKETGEFVHSHEKEIAERSSLERIELCTMVKADLDL